MKERKFEEKNEEKVQNSQKLQKTPVNFVGSTRSPLNFLSVTYYFPELPFCYACLPALYFPLAYAMHIIFYRVKMNISLN